MSFDDRLLVAAEIAERLAVPESWVREQTREGRLPYVQLGRYKRYSWPDVAGYLEEQKAGGAPWRREPRTEARR